MGARTFNVQEPDQLFDLLLYSQNNVKMHISYQNLKYLQKKYIKHMCYKIEYVFIKNDYAKNKNDKSWNMQESVKEEHIC